MKIIINPHNKIIIINNNNLFTGCMTVFRNVDYEVSSNHVKILHPAGDR